MKYWLITYQQKRFSDNYFQQSNCVTSKSPAQWLVDTTKEHEKTCKTQLLFAIEITEDDYTLILDNI
jgi:hypothetical protein